MTRVLLWTLLVTGSVSVAWGQDHGFGIGIMLGEPTGLSGKGWTGPRTAIDGGIAWSFRSKGYLHLHIDHLWHFPPGIATSERIVPYLGIGGRLVTSESATFGVRIPFGLTWWPHGVPLDVFLELAPILDLTPASTFRMNGGIGARYFFR